MQSDLDCLTRAMIQAPSRHAETKLRVSTNDPARAAVIVSGSIHYLANPLAGLSLIESIERVHVTTA